MMNIRIVQILIDSDDLKDVPTWAKRSVADRFKFSMRGDNMASEPVCNVDKRFDDVMGVLREAGIKHEIMDISDDYDLYVTSAPEAFDYGYHVPVATLKSDDNVTERLIALQRQRAEYQIDRNSSGLHYTRKVQ